MKLIPPVNEVKKFLIIFYIVGIIGFAIPFTQNLFILLTPWALLMNLVLLLYFHKPLKASNYLVFATVALAGFFIEVLGVKTGKIFGQYTYGSVLGIKILETPLLIGINWFLLTYCATMVLKKFIRSRYVLALSGAVLVTFFDWIMEPVAIYTGMWKWHFNEVPLQNYIMWFLISLVFIFLLSGRGNKSSNPLAGTILILQFGFFAILNAIIKLF